MLEEIAGLGFEYAELSHGVRVSLVTGILRAVDEGLIKISSVHNFCPLPMGVNVAAPNIYQPTATGRQEKILWYRNTLKTIDFAERIGARVMVIHSGSMRFLWGDPADRLEAFYRERLLREEPDEATRAAYDKLREKTLRKLRRKARRATDRLVTSFRSIVEAAREKGVRIGVENREGLTELPLDAQMGDLLERLGEPEIFGYWHDAGHAQLKHNLGLLDHHAMLEAQADRQLGFHLHDVSAGDRDHCEIGTGVIDWEMLGRHLRPHHVVVLELSPRLKSDAIRASKTFVEERVLPQAT